MTYYGRPAWLVLFYMRNARVHERMLKYEIERGVDGEWMLEWLRSLIHTNRLRAAAELNKLMTGEVDHE